LPVPIAGKAFAPILQANCGGALLNVLSVASWINGGALGQQIGRLVADQRAAPGTGRTKTQVLGLHMAYVDTDLTRGFDVPKTSPEQIVQRALDGLEAGAEEVLADELTQRLKQAMTAERPGYLQAQQA